MRPMGGDGSRVLVGTNGTALVGRDAGLSRVEEVLLAAGSGPVSLLLEREPGIGKTRLWEEAVCRADGREYRVLLCRHAPSCSGSAVAHRLQAI